MHATRYLVIAGSSRAVRRSPAIAAWVATLGAEIGDAPFDVVEIADLGLGLDDEPAMPAKGGGYACPSTRAWSGMIGAARGVVLVTPQYNWGYPAPLKNAIDHLYAEWRGKPALIVSYGGHGGDRCSRQLREVLTGLHMRVADAAPALGLARARIEADDGAIEPAVDFAAHESEVRAALAEFVALSVQPA